MTFQIFRHSKTHLCYELDGVYVLFEQRFPRTQFHAVRHRIRERVPVQIRRRHVIADQMHISLLDRTLSILTNSILEFFVFHFLFSIFTSFFGT